VVIDTADAPLLMQLDDGCQDLDLLDQLRGTGEPRPKVDPELAGGLREWLEDSLAGPAVRIGSRLVTAPLTGPLGRQRAGSGSVHDEMVTNLVRCVFRQWVTTGTVHRPLEDALEALSIWGDRGGVVEAVNRLDADRRSALADEVAGHASIISDAWPALCPAWFPRTRERICVPLCGGRILLGSVVDLVIGTQASKEATVCLVQVGTTPTGNHVNLPELHFIALLETLRSGAPPCRVARYVTGSGELHVESVDEHMLVSALVKTVEAAERACSQAGPQVAGLRKHR
jgi:hypothetical protein